jgi:putative hemolysin
MHPLLPSRLSRAMALLLIGTALGAVPAAQAESPGPANPPGRSLLLPAPRLANPASIHCLERGGKLTLLRREDGGEYGVCIFADGRQCEEWALWRAECPPGGVAVPADTAPAERYCLIRGGNYRPASPSAADREAGVCTFPGGDSCDARAYYRGTCSPRR